MGALCLELEPAFPAVAAAPEAIEATRETPAVEEPFLMKARTRCCACRRMTEDQEHSAKRLSSRKTNQQ